MTMAVLYIVLGSLFVLGRDPSDAAETLLLAEYAVLAVSATVVPFVAVTARQRLAGAVLLGAWAIGLILQWIGVAVDGIDGYYRDAGVLVVILLTAFVALAVYLERSDA